jgi:RNA polymerase sigma-70 factor (ECF subfamily)
VNTEPQALFSVQVRECACRIGREGIGALEELYGLTASRLYRYAMAVTQHHQDAEDVLQAAMVRITIHPKGLIDAIHPWAYLLRVVRNEALRVAQKQKTRRTREQFTLPEILECAETVTQDLQGPESSEIRQFVQAAMNMLPAEQLEIVVLKIWEELTFAEISQILDESPNTVASRYRYAMQKLNQSLESVMSESLRDE